MTTAKWFILIALVSLVAFVILAGAQPFSFGDAYFRPRASTNPFPSPSFKNLPENAQPTEINEGVDIEVGEGITIDR